MHYKRSISEVKRKYKYWTYEPERKKKKPYWTSLGLSVITYMDIVSQFLKTPSIKIYIGRNIKSLSASIKQTESTVHNQGANHILPNVPRRNYTDSL